MGVRDASVPGRANAPLIEMTVGKAYLAASGLAKLSAADHAIFTHQAVLVRKCIICRKRSRRHCCSSHQFRHGRKAAVRKLGSEVTNTNIEGILLDLLHFVLCTLMNGEMIGSPLGRGTACRNRANRPNSICRLCNPLNIKVH